MSKDVSTQPPKDDVAARNIESIPVAADPQPAPSTTDSAAFPGATTTVDSTASLPGPANNNNANNKQQQQQQQQMPPLLPPAPHTHASHSMYHPYPPPPSASYAAGPYSAVVGNSAALPSYHPHHAPPGSRPPQQQVHGSTSHSHPSQQAQQSNTQGPPPAQGPQAPTALPHGSSGPNNHRRMPSHGGVTYEREDQHSYHGPVPVRSHPSDSDYRGHSHHPQAPPIHGGAYGSQPPPPPHYGPPAPDDRRWMGPEGSVVVSHPPPPPPHHGHMPYTGYDGHYGKPHAAQSFPPPPPPVGPGQHMSYRYPHPVYPSTASAANGRGDETARTVHGLHPQQQAHPQPPVAASVNNNVNNNTAGAAEPFNDVDGREGATSPSQIELSHRDEVTNMGCTCKKTKCLKLYCQCFAVKIYCGSNCRCLVCFNTTKHEKQRKDAMRSILSRNPTAFDTKFSKSKERKTKEQPLVLAHKLGCKCRKSACMKKYCECYAGSVKCSANCRCIGCKNIPSSFSPGKPGDNGSAIREGGIPVPAYEIPAVAHGNGGRTGREPWMMNAAQNLAFLKHASPTAEKRVTAVTDTADAASMPSLAAASSDTSPGDRTVETAKQAEPAKLKEDSNGSAVNSLLMAAMAMTEFQSQKTENIKSSSDIQKAEGDSKVSDNLKLAYRKGLRPSPKRKSSERGSPEGTLGDLADNGEQDAHTQYTAVSGAGDSDEHADVPGSPVDPRDLKRTRLGSVRKKMEWEKGGVGQKSSPVASSKANKTTLHETPDQKTTLDLLTPVSARCIDFRRMNVNEKKENPLD